MSYRYCDQRRQEYLSDGFTFLRNVIPAALLADLRRETDKARDIARRQRGPQAQRLQPVYAYEDLDHRPFRDFLNLPEMRATVENILGPDHGPSDIMGVLLEPAEQPWCTAWHRDWIYNAPNIDAEAFWQRIGNMGMFNQINAALYDDHSLWVVRGSHAREDLPAERDAFDAIPPPAPVFPEDASAEERELICMEYVRRMPGAEPVTLFAGDVAFYRAVTWHIGNYVPYSKRATLHDGYYGPEDYAWQAQAREWREAARTVSAG